MNVASSVWFDLDKNIFVAPCIGLGAVAPKVIRASQAEAYLEGRTITPEAMAEAGRIASTMPSPSAISAPLPIIGAIWSSVLTKRTLEGAYALAQSRQSKQ